MAGPILDKFSRFKQQLRQVPRTVAVTLLVLVGLVLAVGIAYHFTFGAPMLHAGPQLFTVSLSASRQDVVNALYEEGFIRNKWAFNIALNVEGAGAVILPGGYKISKSSSVWDLVENYLTREPALEWVVIPEGLRKEQIADLLAAVLGWSDQQRSDWVTTYTAMDWDHSEGVYFPDTYLIPRDEPGLQVAQRLQSRFNGAFAPYSDKFLKENIKWDTALKIASLVQREAGGKADMPLIAGIIWNRLLQGMKLEIDATLQYVRDSALAFDDLCKEPGNSQAWQCTCGESDNTCYRPRGYYKGLVGWWSAPSPADKKIDSPYNTYLNKGLPPHPIANPGLDAIDAVLNSTETDCLFYLHDSNKHIHCAKTYQEHLQNIETYLR